MSTTQDTRPPQEIEGWSIFIYTGLGTAFLYLGILKVLEYVWGFGFEGAGGGNVPAPLMISLVLCSLHGATAPFMLHPNIWDKWKEAPVEYNGLLPLTWLAMLIILWVLPLWWLYSVTH